MTAWVAAATTLLWITVNVSLPDLAWGQSSSGGYARPGGGYTSGYSASSRRAPIASSGGYSRRSYSGPAYTGNSPGDRAMSRSVSSQALRDYQAAQRSAATYARRPPSSSGGRGWGSVAERRPPVWGGQQSGGRIAREASPGAGLLTGVALWAALNSLSSPGQATFFHNNRYDPEYVQWRQEADREAAKDPELAAKLAQLDARLAQLEGQPRNPSTAPTETRGGPAPASPESGSRFVWPVLFIGIAVLVLLSLWRRRAARPATAALAPGLLGTAATRFRVGMTLPVDRSPFLLAAGLTKVEPSAESGLISVEAVGLLRDGNVLLHRLYLPGGRAFFQLHLGSDGRPDECRYFSVLDEVAPANDQEWGFWLDPAQGMIGWPSFQTKDSKVYPRVWAPSGTRIAPRKFEETRQYLDRVEQRQMQAMLYGAPTGGIPPAPATEYILVSAIEAAGQAWVGIDAGIDINPAALTLPSISLEA
jgi:hypothetical protein